jgi:hypothetical protein
VLHNLALNFSLFNFQASLGVKWRIIESSAEFNKRTYTYTDPPSPPPAFVIRRNNFTFLHLSFFDRYVYMIIQAALWIVCTEWCESPLTHPRLTLYMR